MPCIVVMSIYHVLALPWTSLACRFSCALSSLLRVDRTKHPGVMFRGQISRGRGTKEARQGWAEDARPMLLLGAAGGREEEERPVPPPGPTW